MYSNLRKLFWVFTFFALIGLSVPQMPVIGVDSAFSQVKKKKKRKNLFQLLFKRSRKFNRKNKNASKKLRRKLNAGSRKKKRRRKVAAAPIVPKVEKSENAAKVLVVGDFMADGTGWGLEQVFASNPNVVIVNKAEGLSGIVREDVVNWPKTIPTLLAEHKPAAVVVLLGMNDRQQLKAASGKFNKLTEEWKKQYVARANALAASVSPSKLIWLGLPPVRQNSMNTDYLAFNGLYRTAAENVGGTFVDVWDGYTNAEGKFISAGPDINGQIVRLRSSDGINMTKAGRRKLAFFAEKAVRKAVGLGSDSLLAGLPNFDLPIQPVAPQYDPAKSGRTVVVSLEGPALDGGTVLEGADGFLKTDDGDKSVSHALVSRGNSAIPQIGRVDASWGQPKPKEQPNIAKDDKTKTTKPELKPGQAASVSPAQPVKADIAEVPVTPAVSESISIESSGNVVRKTLPTVTNISN